MIHKMVSALYTFETVWISSSEKSGNVNRSANRKELVRRLSDLPPEIINPPPPAPEDRNTNGLELSKTRVPLVFVVI